MGKRAIGGGFTGPGGTQPPSPKAVRPGESVFVAGHMGIDAHGQRDRPVRARCERGGIRTSGANEGGMDDGQDVNLGGSHAITSSLWRGRLAPQCMLLQSIANHRWPATGFHADPFGRHWQPPAIHLEIGYS